MQVYLHYLQAGIAESLISLSWVSGAIVMSRLCWFATTFGSRRPSFWYQVVGGKYIPPCINYMYDVSMLPTTSRQNYSSSKAGTKIFSGWRMH